MAGDCPKGQFRCVHCDECVGNRVPYEKHIGQCVVNQARKRPKSNDGGRRSTDKPPKKGWFR